MIEKLNGVTLAVSDMAKSVRFYRDTLGLCLVYGNEESSFSTFDVGGIYLNLELREAVENGWGRTIFRVSHVDQLYTDLTRNGLKPEPPRDGSWGERYFHIRDPDGHELGMTMPIGRA